MDTTEKKIPNYVFENRLFARRLQRNLNDELERLYHLLTEQVRLLKEREALMSKVHAAVEQRWTDEEPALVAVRTERTEEETNHESAGEVH